MFYYHDFQIHCSEIIHLFVCLLFEQRSKHKENFHDLTRLETLSGVRATDLNQLSNRSHPRTLRISLCACYRYFVWNFIRFFTLSEPPVTNFYEAATRNRKVL